MAITDITAEYAELRARQELEDRIDGLSPARSAFVLKALLIAGHVDRSVLALSLNLADSIRED